MEEKEGRGEKEEKRTNSSIREGFRKIEGQRGGENQMFVRRLFFNGMSLY